jgi:hypothetical protein
MGWGPKIPLSQAILTNQIGTSLMTPAKVKTATDPNQFRTKPLPPVVNIEGMGEVALVEPTKGTK